MNVAHLQKLLATSLAAGMALLQTSCSKWNEPPRKDYVSGTIEVDETRVASRYGGRVQEIHAREGETLKPDQLIVTLSAPELIARQEQTTALLAELKAGARKEELEAAKNDWQSLIAELDFARSEQKRVTELFDQKTVPESERDRAVMRVGSLEKNVAAAKSRYDLLAAGTRQERIAQGEAQLEEIKYQLSEMKITAPQPAALEVLHVKAGDVVGPNQDVATLLLTQHLWVRVYVPEPWLGFIKVGQPVKVKVDSYPDKEFSGEVEQVSRTAEFTPRNVQTVSDRVKQVFGIKVRLPTDTEQLRAGMSADVRFPDVPTVK